MLSTERRLDAWALAVFAGLALWLVRDALAPDRALLSRESLQNCLPWSAVLEPVSKNRFLGDQARIYYPYLLEAARVYRGQADPLWTTRGGGGQPFLGNITSSLLHPLTLLAALVPWEWMHLVPTLQALAVLVLSAWFTWLFLRRLRLSVPAAAFGALAFGFGGHQVLWLQYALSHTLLALPFTFWAVERVVELRSRRRTVVLALGFALLVLGGHPETGLVAGLVAGLWALWRLWDAHGRPLVLGAASLALALSAVQWVPFLEYASLSHGKALRDIQAQVQGGPSFGASAVLAFFVLAALALLRASQSNGFGKRLAAVACATVAIVMARRMGTAMSSSVLFLPELYGDPVVSHATLAGLVRGGVFTGAQDFPGLNAGYAGVLPPLLLMLGFLRGLGGGFVRFFALVSVALWGAAFGLPCIAALVGLVPGLGHVAPTRLLGPVGFLTACGGAMVLERFVSHDATPRVLRSVGRIATTGLLALVASYVVLRMPVDPHGGRTIVSKLRSPPPNQVFDGRRPITICFDVPEDADDLRIQLDAQMLWHGQAARTGPDDPITQTFPAQRTEEGRHRLVVEYDKDGRTYVLADQPLAIRRERNLATRDLLAVAASLALVGWLLGTRRRHGAWWAVGIVALDVLTFADGYNVATPVDELYPPTATVDFLRAQQPPFRIFTEGTILPPDTQFVAGVDHLFSYDNLEFDRTRKWIRYVQIDDDQFASFSFSRENVEYASPRFDALDVEFVLTDRATDLSDIEGMQLVHESETRVWRNTGNLGRAWVVGSWLDLGKESASRLIAADPAEYALLEGPGPSDLGGRGSAHVVRHAGSEIEVDVEADGPALLVLAESRAPGWEASVDGAPFEETLRADVAWQCIPVPAGSSHVVFRYAPARFAWALGVSIAAALLALLMVLRRG
ncbi:MAG: hypothetical protein H6825_04640 [Planctomycetes bacterium]|nr:hypothetical protein [Planctomycetota bacterium]